jgi:hypothetical protein
MTEPPRAFTIVLGEERFELSGEAVAALLDHLWKGNQRGAVIAAARLSEAIARPEETGLTIAFAPYEIDAVREGLQADESRSGRLTTSLGPEQ